MVKKLAKKDILIPVIGATGAGKSSFINSLLGEEKMAVGRSLAPHTSELGFGYIKGHPLLQEYRIVLIDTPGFDDTGKDDEAILTNISTWLKDSYKKGAKLGGVIYLHDITAARFTGTATRKMFRSICGKDMLDNIVLGTTKWDLHIPDSALRHNQLVAQYWKPLLDKGAKAVRIEGTASAWTIIDEIIAPRTQKSIKLPVKNTTERALNLVNPIIFPIAQSKKQDVLILVMGATGVGKSTFINTLIGHKRMVVSGGLKSCTTEPDVATIDQHPAPDNYRLNLIDTPGFDDTIDADFAILEKIATWLEKSYKEGAKLGGIIYLHDITTPRFEGPAIRHLKIFRTLCGKGSLDHVVLATTKWGLNIPYSEENQKQLETKHWKPLTDKGAHVRRFHGSHESAQRILDAIISTSFERPRKQTVRQIRSAMSGPTSHTIARPETFSQQFMKRALRPFVGLFRKRPVSL